MICLGLFFLQAGAASHASGEKEKSALYLVSVGVGDVDLITVRAINTIKKSDVLVCSKKAKEKFAEYLKGKEFLDSSLGSWRYCCFNAANAALRKSITSGKETSSVVLISRRDIEKMSAHHPTMVIFTMGTEFKEKESVIRGTLN